MRLEMSEAMISQSREGQVRKYSATTMAIVYGSSPDDAAADHNRSGNREGTNCGINAGRARLVKKEK